MKGEKVKMLCQICKKCSSKYKCPSCYVLYCSLACFKAHKDKLCEIETRRRDSHNSQAKEDTINHIKVQDGDDDSEDEDRLSPNDLEKLGQCGVTKSMLKNKALREILADIDKAEDPQTVLKSAMNEPLLTEFVNHCLSVVEPNQQKNDI